MDVRVNGQPIEATVKTLKPGVSHEAVLSQLYGQRDHLDTYVARAHAGQDVLVLTRSSRDLRTDDRLEIDGRPAIILHAENEVNTSQEVTHLEVLMRAADKVPLPATVYAILSSATVGITGSAIAAVASKTKAPAVAGALMGAGVAGLGVLAFLGIKERMAKRAEEQRPDYGATNAIAH